MTDRELMQKALEAMGTVGADWICEASHHAKKDQHQWGEICPLQQRWHIAFQALRERLAQPEPAPGYCKHCQQYTIEEPLPAQPETVMAEYKFQTYAAYKTDGEMKIGVVPETRPATREEKIVRPGVYEVPVEQEPVAWNLRYNRYPREGDLLADIHLLRWQEATPPRREWVGLTQEDWLALGCKTNEEIRVGLAIQAKLREKNA